MTTPAGITLENKFEINPDCNCCIRRLFKKFEEQIKENEKLLEENKNLRLHVRLKF